MKNLFRKNLLLLTAIVLVSTNGYGQKLQKKWTFDNPLNTTAASLGGKDLVLVGKDSVVAGPRAGNGAVRIFKGSYYKLTHGFPKNGGGADSLHRVNEYSVLVDFKIPDLTKWYTFFQTDSTNTSDGDCFIKSTTGLVGTTATGYSTAAVTPNVWHRFVITIKNGVQHDTYLDGQILKVGTPLAVDGRFALDSLLLMFADNDGDDGDIDVAEVSIWNYALTSSEVAALKTVATTLSQGKWTFDNPLKTTAAVPGFGNDLVLVGKDSVVPGPSAGNGAVRIFKGSHYKLTHGFPQNGAGADSLHRVNKYSIMIDFKIPDLTKWYTFFQLNPSNTDDGDCFIKKTTGLVGTTASGYSTAAVTPNDWHRFVITVNNGVQHDIYLDGKILKVGTPLAIDGRFALDSLLLMFGDDDGDDGDIDIAEVSIWDNTLTATEVANLGKVFVSNQGKWTFDNPLNTVAAVPGYGKDLVLVGRDSVVPGPSAGNGAVRIFKGSHYKLTHGFAPNGGGADSLHRVNEYSILIDFKIPDLTKWYTFFQLNPSNTDDGDCFIKKTTGLVGTTATGYSTAAVSINDWHRFVITVKNGVQHDTYLDGTILKVGTPLAVDGRFALDSLLLMFGDDDGDDGDIDIAEVSMWNYPLTATEVTKLGKVYVDQVTFQVNMSTQMKIKRFDKAKDTVVVRGDFNGWGGNALKLSDPDGDSVYVGTFSVPNAPKSITYKFVKLSPNVAGDQWESSNDRKDTIPSTPRILKIVYFNNDSTTVYSDNFITFQVNMKKQLKFAKFDKAKDSVVVRGDFSGWSGNAYVLAGNSTDSIYKGTFNITSVKKIIYKFVIHKATGDTWQSTPDIVDSLLNGTPRTEPLVWFSNDSVLTSVRREDDGVVKIYSLDQNYPNPFNPSTTINYQIPFDNLVTMKIYNILGQEVVTVVNEHQNAGRYQVSLNAGKLSSGIYFYRIESGSFTALKKMLIIK